jgi:multiple sugar transport system permease protein
MVFGNGEKMKNISLRNKDGAGEQSNIAWLIPLFGVCALVFLYPLFEIARLSFTNAPLIGRTYRYTFSTYITTFVSPGFFQMMAVTLLFVIVSVFFQLALGFIIAFYVDYGQKKGWRGTLVVRTAVLISWAIPGVVIGVIWKMLYSEIDSGVLTYITRMINPHARVPFLSSPHIALISTIIANVWRGTAYSMILLYAGLQTFPVELIEAAIIDRANFWQRLIHVIIPYLMPIILITSILVTVQTFNTFDMVMALTGGGPGTATEVIALNIYKSIFHEFNLARGAAVSVMLLVINIIMTIIYFHISGKGEAL